jgi:two-component sensor histidine kinase
VSHRIADDFFKRSRALTVPQRYLGATALVLLAWLVRSLIGPVSQPYNYLLFECAVAISAVLFARGSSVWATLLGALIVVYFYVPPTHTFVLNEEEGEAFFIFLASALLISAAGESVRNRVERLEASAEEERLRERQKDALLREQSHRTRNNLHLITSALSLQIIRATTPEARGSLQTALDRIKSIARVDDLLRDAGQSDVVDAREYLAALAEDMRTSLTVLHPINFSFHAEPYPLTRDIATALGIAVNELITNALKYAFPEERSGHISIEFHADESDLVLTVEDNGKGYTEEVSEGTGMRLIKSLVGWCQGTVIREDVRPGCRVVILIPKPPTKQPNQHALPL